MKKTVGFGSVTMKCMCRNDKKAEVFVLGGVLEQRDGILPHPDIDIPNGIPIR
ncbi:hypothetical protein ACUIAK_15565 [Bacillus cytotoxicus]